MSQQTTQAIDSNPAEKPSLAALLKRAMDDEDLPPSLDDRERYVRDDEDGYSG